MTRPEIDIIGTGNLASSLAPALELNGYIINNVYGRTLRSAKEISDRLYQASTKDSLDFSDSNSSVFILAVSDDSIEEVARELVLPEVAIIAHTSGTKALSTLGYTASPNIGVFYPIQTFSKGKRVDFKGVPILVEGENGSIELASDFWLRVTTREGTYTQRVKPRCYHWMDVKYAAVPGSIVNTNRDFLTAR